MTLPNDISRCSNERCKKKLKCKRYLDCLPFEVYSYSEFDENDCEFFIENELKNKQKQALIDMMRGDEELGLYDEQLFAGSSALAIRKHFIINIHKTL